MREYDQFTTSISIDLDAIAHNAAALKKLAGNGTKLIAVVKDNAYGHGAIPVAKTALKHGASYLAVARVDEGIELRQAGIDVPILLLTYALPAEASAIAQYDLTATIITWEVAGALSAAADAQGKTAIVHLKVDTGMGRYGLLPHEVIAFMDGLQRFKNLEVEGIFTHFATSDEADKSYTQQQFVQFMEVLNSAQAAGYSFKMRHTANSGAILDLPETHLDAVRAGIALYGLYPSEEVSRTVDIHPALTLRSHVARLRILSPGSGIGYGKTYVTSRDTRVALVPVGYGDGYRRTLSNKGFVLIQGQRAPICGRVSMDQIVVDVSEIEDVQQDDEVVLIGSQKSQTLSIEEVARLAGTINYEVTTGLAHRIPRLFIQNGKVASITRMIGDQVDIDGGR